MGFSLAHLDPCFPITGSIPALIKAVEFTLHDRSLGHELTVGMPFGPQPMGYAALEVFLNLPDSIGVESFRQTLKQPVRND